MTRVLDENRPARADNAVVFACDADHLPFALFAAERIRRLEPDRCFDIVICLPDLDMVAKDRLDGAFRFCALDVSELPEVPLERDWISKASYFRWLTPSAFAADYDSLLYLDTDIYLRRSGISRLFKRANRDAVISAVADFDRITPMKPKLEAHVTARVRDLGGTDGTYYNSGVLLIRPRKFLDIDGPSRLLRGITDNLAFDHVYGEQDQGAMNLAFADVIVPLDPRYNWRSRHFLNPIMVDRFDPVILHFTSRRKPWAQQDDPFVATFTAEYLAFLTAEMPGFTPPVMPDTAAARLHFPKYRWRVLNQIRVALYHRRSARQVKRIWSDHLETRTARMSAAIAAAGISGEPALAPPLEGRQGHASGVR